MSKDESLILKGLAILFMLWYHLFNRYNVDCWTPFVIIGNTSLVAILQSITNPVYIYVILSGYGLYKSYQISGISRCSVIRRTLKLFIHYWLVLTIFAIIVGGVLRPDIFPGSLEDFLLSYTGIWTKYCGEAWFLLPYIFLLITSKAVFQLMDKKAIVFFISITIVFITSVYFKRHSGLSNEYGLGLLLSGLSFIFPFGIGSIMAKYQFFEKVRSVLHSNYLTIPVIFSACVFRYFMPNFHIIFIPVIMLCVISLNRNKYADKVLSFIGRHSTSMWFIHGFFYRSLFHDYIYVSHRPIIIYITLIVVSLLSAICIDWLNSNLQQFIFHKKRTSK